VKDELLLLGYSFKSKTDTEVVVSAYHEWGVNCLHKFNGMWSFAILDTIENVIFCSRDRLGEKPFYYNYEKSCFSFSSEIKQILTLPHVQVNQKDSSVCDYFHYKTYNSLNEQTFFKNIYELPPGCFLKLNLNSSINGFEITEWWNIQQVEKVQNAKEIDLIEKFKFLLFDSIKLRLRSDVPIGSALSGGLDSSGIVSIIAQIIKDEKNDFFTKYVYFYF
jgi:asparagine synthase (glutamine-hydrolysing)